MDKLIELKSGLVNAGKAVKDGNNGLKEGMSTLYEGIRMMKDGTEELHTKLGGD